MILTVAVVVVVVVASVILWAVSEFARALSLLDEDNDQ